ncbi:PRTRC system protein A [Rhodanobacter denitrificans]|uniref:PRTRC system protein A n=1 Tax=Rhodanobacter denitrificans TaxID=666685 RepID=UPI001F3ED036|nr:PRTRC system protein A [Rhodanobacter denitrificans]UJJ60412.1 PRTRC system protein A [Rhodanobacter denitrificans]
MSAAVDPRDAVLQAAFPTVPVPRFGALPDLPVGRKRLLVASDGLYLEVRSTALHARLRLASVDTPHGACREFLAPAGGRLDRNWIGKLAELALAGGESEVASGIVLGEDGWRLHRPRTLSSSGAHVTYRDDFEDDALLVDMHSHGALDAFFSSTDDAGDLARPGPYLAVVLGRCQSRESLSWVVRFVCAPYLIALDTERLTDLGCL